MAQNYAVLLPPSEGKAGGGEGAPWIRERTTFAVLDEARRQIITALQNFLFERPDAASKLLGVTGTSLEDAIAANLAINHSPTLPAIERYTGVMFTYLDYPGMEAQLQQRFQERAVFFSGLWGLLAPCDRIPDYKLKMDASLPPLGRLSSWWRPRLSPVLNAYVAGKVVWNLLPGVHAVAWEPNEGGLAGHYTVRFVREIERKGTIEWQSVSHWSKALKGALVRFILEQELTAPEALVRFEHPEGYHYSPESSTLDGTTGELIFVKPLNE